MDCCPAGLQDRRFGGFGQWTAQCFHEFAITCSRCFRGLELDSPITRAIALWRKHLCDKGLKPSEVSPEKVYTIFTVDKNVELRQVMSYGSGKILQTIIIAVSELIDGWKNKDPVAD